MVNSKRKGTKFEYDCKEWLKQQLPHAEVFRSPASLGSADLIVISRYEVETESNIVICSYVGLIQCKYLRKYMSNREAVQLSSDANRIGALAFLAYRDKPRGKIFIDQLWPNVEHRVKRLIFASN